MIRHIPFFNAVFNGKIVIFMHTCSTLYVGGYQVPVNRPPFCADLTPNYPLFPLVQTQWPPFFPLSYQILHTNCKLSRASRSFWEMYKFCRNLNIKFANFDLKLHFWTHTENPPFSAKSDTECPLVSFSGRHLYVTFIFECPSPGTVFY